METAEVSTPAEESTEESQAEEAEAPAQEEPEEAAEAEESAQEPQEPQKDADVSLAPHEDEEMSYEWRVYKKFLEYQKAGKAADFAYHFTLDGCTVEMTPVGNGVYDAHITGKGECTTAYKAYVTGADETIGFERSFYEYGKVVRNGIECTSIRLKTPEPDSVKELKKELGVSSLDNRYNQPKIRNLTFGSGFSSIGVMAGFFGKTSVEKMVVPSNIKTIVKNAFYCTLSNYWTFGAIEFSEGLVSIGYDAFSGATVKKELVLPSTLTTIGEYAFDGAETPSVVVKGNVTIKNYGLCCMTKSVLFCGDVNAGLNSLPGDGVEKIVIKGDFKGGGRDFFNALELKKVEIDGNAYFAHGSFMLSPNIESLVIKGNAFFPTKTFRSFPNGNPKTSPKKIDIGGNATFEENISSERGQNQTQSITVKGIVKQANNSFAGTGFEKTTVKSHGTTKSSKSTKKTKDTAKAQKKTTLSATKLTSVKYKKNKKTPKKSTTTVKWKRNKKGTGYQLQYSTNKKFKKGVKTINIKKNKTTSKTIKGMKKGKYFFRIRTVGKINKKTVRSKWSGLKGVTVK